MPLSHSTGRGLGDWRTAKPHGQPHCSIDSRGEPSAIERCLDADMIDNIPIEVREVVGGDPQLSIVAATNYMDIEFIDVLVGHLEGRHEAREPGRLIFRVPVLGDSFRVHVGQHRVEDWLMREARRKSRVPGGSDQRKLLYSHWSEQSHGSGSLPSPAT